MTSLITGATGFIGHHLLRELANRGESVIAVSREQHFGNSEELVSWHALPKDHAAWTDILDKVSTVYHLAWSSSPQSSNEDPLGDASENILSTLRLLEAAKTKNNLRLVFPSSGGTVYGILKSVPAPEVHGTEPRCAYGISKLTVEKYLALYHELWGMDCVALRISNAYGPGQRASRGFGAIATFAARAMNGEPITIFGDGAIIRDYLYIDDLIECLIAAGRHRGGPIVMNVGSGRGTSLNEIMEVLRRLSSKELNVTYCANRSLDIPVSVLDISLVESILQWRPSTPFDIGIEVTIKAFHNVLQKT